MLWILVPMVAVMVWLVLSSLGSMAQRFDKGNVARHRGDRLRDKRFRQPGRNRDHGAKAATKLAELDDRCVIAIPANFWLISRFGVTGAAFGILLPYLLQGVLRYRALRLVFRWRNPWEVLAIR